MTVATTVVETNNGGTNNVVDFTYNEEGAEGNYIGVTIAAVAVASQPLAIDYGVTTPNVITIKPANSSGDGTTISTTGTILVNSFNGTLAQCSVLSSNTNPSDGDTIKVGGYTYRFKTTTAAIGDIFIGASADATLISLGKVINGVGTLAASGADAFTGTLGLANVYAATTTAGAAITSATASITSHTIYLTARQPGVNYNGITTTTPVGTTFTLAAATLGGAGAVAGVDPLDWKSRTLFTAAGNGTITGILAAGAFTYLSTGGTAGADDTNGYTSLTTMMQKGGWVVPGTLASIVIANDSADSFKINGANGDNTITNYQAFVPGYSSTHWAQATTSNALLAACKTRARYKASRNQARDWLTARTGYYTPLLFSP